MTPSPIVMLALAATLAVAIGVSLSRAEKRRRRRWRATTADPSWKPILLERLPIVEHFSEARWNELAGLIRVFLARKRFEGCGGLTVTEEMKVTVAAQACMLLLGRDAKIYPKLKTVLLYPHTFTDGETARLGESWSTGVVVLSWNSVVGGARNFTDGHNVTFHEFAHQLDQASGAANGAPILADRAAYQTWARVFSAEFEELVEDAEHGRKNVMDDYGATNPAEFFAVATETYFEKPRRMKREHPELFEKLRGYYKVNPLEWI